MIAADSGNGVSIVADPRNVLFINPDLTVHLHRMPVGHWVALRAKSVLHPNGVGLAESGLFDRGGAIGRSLQSLFVDMQRPS